MDIKVQIIAVELAEAINNLAAALSAKSEADTNKETGKRRRRRNQNEETVKAATEETEETSEKEDEVTVDEPKPEPETDDMFDSEEEEEKPVLTRADIQKRLKEIAGDGKAAGIKKLVISYGAKKLSEVPDNMLADLLAKAEAL